MLFHSDEFLFAFLPLVFAVWWALSLTAPPRIAQAWLLLASFFFYGWWEPRLLPLLLVSIGFNYAAGQSLTILRGGWRTGVFALSLGANIGSLVYFKYADFGISIWNALVGSTWPALQPVLPLAISFFTFQQAAYLVDCYRGQSTDRDPLRYALFVTFFPQLIAGPIVHHHELMPQFDRGHPRNLSRHLAVGLTILAIGLFKKTVLADHIAQFADPVFAAADRGAAAPVGEAWLAMIAFTLQIYFDFSAYSDMAIGVSRLFGIILPLNFDSPLRATSIGELWRRWHMTLSRFLRDYLYIPLGGSRHGSWATCRNLLITMLLCGLWHGAGWNFVIWGGLHGVFLCGEHLWGRWRAAAHGQRSAGWSPSAERWMNRLRCVRTCLLLALTFVFFRLPTVDGAVTFLQSLVGGDQPASGIASLVAGAGLKLSMAWVWCGLGLAIVWGCPNTQQLMGRFEPALDYRCRPDRQTWQSRWLLRLQWRPHWVYAMSSALILGLALSAMSRAEEFLYFQF